MSDAQKARIDEILGKDGLFDDKFDAMQHYADLGDKDDDEFDQMKSDIETVMADVPEEIFVQANQQFDAVAQ